MTSWNFIYFHNLITFRDFKSFPLSLTSDFGFRNYKMSKQSKITHGFFLRNRLFQVKRVKSSDQTLSVVT